MKDIEIKYKDGHTETIKYPNRFEIAVMNAFWTVMAVVILAVYVGAKAVGKEKALYEWCKKKVAEIDKKRGGE